MGENGGRRSRTASMTALAVGVAMGDSQGKAVGAAAAGRVDERVIAQGGDRQQLAEIADGGLHHLERDEAFDVGAKLGEVLGAVTRGVAFQLVLDPLSGNGGVEISSGAVGDQ